MLARRYGIALLISKTITVVTSLMICVLSKLFTLHDCVKRNV